MLFYPRMETQATSPNGQSPVITEGCGIFVREASGRVSGPVAVGPGETPDALPPDALDRRVFASLAALETDTPGFLCQIMAEFHEGASRRLVVLGKALRAGDAGALAFEAHGLRGSCGMLGARRMAILAGRLEAMGREGRPEDGLPLLPTLESEYEAVRRALDTAYSLAEIAAA
jgi:HPt (histidine-containing phosphotransfer) domain-containing protein